MKVRSNVKNPKMLVSAFALAVTTEGSHCKDWIARKGKYSLQNTLERLIPEIILSETEKKFRIMTKIATAAFLKVLEGKCGFRRIRIRRQGLDSDGGDLVFCNRRWLHPSDSEDRALLERNFEALCFAFPYFGTRVTLGCFLDVLEEVSSSWNAVLSKVRSRSPDVKFCSPCPSQGGSTTPSRASSAASPSLSRSQSSSNPLRASSSAMDLSNLLNPDEEEAHSTPSDAPAASRRPRSPAGHHHHHPAGPAHDALPASNGRPAAPPPVAHPAPAAAAPAAAAPPPPAAARDQLLASLLTAFSAAPAATAPFPAPLGSGLTWAGLPPRPYAPPHPAALAMAAAAAHAAAAGGRAAGGGWPWASAVGA